MYFYFKKKKKLYILYYISYIFILSIIIEDCLFVIIYNVDYRGLYCTVNPSYNLLYINFRYFIWVIYYYNIYEIIVLFFFFRLAFQCCIQSHFHLINYTYLYTYITCIKILIKHVHIHVLCNT